jgi:hypothetical protein
MTVHQRVVAAQEARVTDLARPTCRVGVDRQISDAGIDRRDVPPERAQNADSLRILYGPAKGNSVRSLGKF